ncbi:hypothetical protein [Leeia oryzae]|uniref:hypothetical protein n=1 Tax=Leeia oryzae TaxID=356662 RepID=UPI0003769DB8|nr:hypothetical protein [Leeia oryzae]
MNITATKKRQVVHLSAYYGAKITYEKYVLSDIHIAIYDVLMCEKTKLVHSGMD